MLRQIAGRQNASIKRAGRLQKKSYRRERGLFVAEGLDLLLAAEEVGQTPVEILVREDLVNALPVRLVEGARANRLDIGVCGAETLGHASSLGGAADVVALYRLPSWSLGDVPLAGGVSVLMHGVGDPGNVGTVVRSAVAFGAVGVLCSPGTADPYGPKALRAGMGAQFLTPVVADVSAADLVARFEAEERRGHPAPTLLLADPQGDVDSRRLGALGQGTVLVLGSERGELPAFDRPVLKASIRQARFDSLNVAMAGTILLYELAREGRRGPGTATPDGGTAVGISPGKAAEGLLA